MAPERKRDENFMKDRDLHGDSNAWCTAQRQKKIYGFDVHVGLNETMDQMIMAKSA